MRVLVPLPVAVSVLGIALTVLTARWRNVQRVLSLGAVSIALAAAIGTLAEVRDGSIAVARIGGWDPSIGITLTADLMASMFLVVSLATVLCVLVYSIGEGGIESRAPTFHPAYLALTAGVSLAFLTGDLFNLFVAFELMLIASYVLMTLGGGREQVTHGMTYVVINLLASTLFITTVALVYEATGTVNLAELSARFPELGSELQLGLGLLFVVVFGIKAAIFPLFFWLPDSYPSAPTAITAIFAGLLTKIGVYALIRVTTVLDLHTLRPILLAAAGITMIVGVLGAIAQDDVKRILSFHIVSQIGYMIMGLALFTVAGLAGAIVFIIHQIPVKTALFLVCGLIERREGTNALNRLGGLVHHAPVMAGLFLLAALSLAGLPPFSGFVAKLSLVEAGISTEAYVIVAVSLVGSVLTLFSMTKIWAGVFWGVAVDPVEHPPAPNRARTLVTTGATLGVVALTIGIAVAAGTIYDWSALAAEGLLEPAGYFEAVRR
jgi:multicomponent Na+:H+ antiporter subunit D